MADRSAPDRLHFVGIGAQKCASTWLYETLAAHPDIGVAPRKELDFFTHSYERGFRWYEHQFSDCPQRVVGEISPSYFHSLEAPERVARHLPDARIIVSFRDPVARAMSNHRHEVRSGHLNGYSVSFEDGLEHNPMYVEQGRYATHLRRWLAHFPNAQVFATLYEDIVTEPDRVARELYAFLGVDDSFVPPGLERRYNRSFANQHPALAKTKDAVYRFVEDHNLRWLWKAASATGVRSLYRRINVVESDEVIPPPDEATVVRLRKEFSDEIRDLSQLIGRDLGAWQ